MSYDCCLLDPVSKEVIKVDNKHFMQGATYQLGGSDELSLSVTYNYSELYYALAKDGIRTIDRMTGLESIPVLTKIIDSLKDNVSDNYYKATEGNAKRAAVQLRTMAQMRPDGIWEIV